MARQTARHARPLCLCCLWVLALLFAATSQAQQYPFAPLGGENAPKGCLFPFEDSHGGLWLAGCETGTEGLYYFDGSRFFSPIQGNFPRVIVRGMAEDSDGGIWLSSSGGLYRVYRGRLEKMAEGEAFAGITRVAPDVFLATIAKPNVEQPVIHADVMRISRTQQGWKVEPILKLPQVQFRLTDKGRILYGCDGGFCELESDEIIRWRPGLVLKVVHYALSVRTGYATDSSVIWRDRFGCVWMRGRNDASYQCSGDPRAITLPASVASIGFPLIFELDDGSIVIPSYTRLAIGRPGRFRIFTGVNGYPGAAGALLMHNGNLFLGTERPYQFSPRFMMEFWSSRDGLDGNAYAMLRLGKKLFAAAGDAIFVLSKDRSRWRPLAKLRAATHLIAGPGNTLLAGSHTEGIVQITPDGHILRRSIPADITMLAQTPDGQFWGSGIGIVRIVLGDRRVVLHPVNLPGPQSGGTDMKVDAEGGLWACYAGGLAHKDALGWHVLSRSDGLLDNECSSLAVEKDGDIWYAYPDLAFSLIHQPAGNHPLLQHFERGGEVGATQSYFLGVDHRGWLWRGGADGIYVATPEQARQGQWLRFDRSDGLPATDANFQSFFEDNDHSIWFGASTSIIHVFPPDDLVHANYAPSIFLSALSWDGGPARIMGIVDAVSSGSDVIVHIGSLQFDRRNALRLRYRILPQQSTWQSGEDLNIHLGKVRWGRHTLEVQARLGDGPWSGTVTKSFVVLTPVWLSWPALLGLALAGSLIVTASYRWRKKRRERASKAFPELAEWRLAALSSEAWQLEGTVLDSRFKVGRMLARGGFATVAEGVDLREEGRACAIKIFRQELASKEWMTHRFQQEVLALEQLHHPNVVGIWGHGTTPGGAPYLVMEFVDGKTLREALEASGIARSMASGYLRQTACALAALHSRGIFHRDLKPDNLMIRRAAPAGQEIVLIDFSIAIVKDADETLHGISRAAGTLYYMAPEQALGYADASTDIHSLAKILVEMLTGKRLSELLPDAAMDLPVRVGEFLRGMSFGLSPAAIDFICAALEFDPSRRPHNAKEFADEVTRDWECGTSVAASGQL